MLRIANRLSRNFDTPKTCMIGFTSLGFNYNNRYLNKKSDF